MKIYNTKFGPLNESSVKYDFDAYIFSISLASVFFYIFVQFFFDRHDPIFSQKHRIHTRLNTHRERKNYGDLSMARPIGITSIIFCR